MRLSLNGLGVACAAGALGAAGLMLFAADPGKKIPDKISEGKWSIHDMERPKPPIVTPGTFSTQSEPGKPPSDAIVLFDGKSLDAWQKRGGGEPTWKLEDGAMVASKADIQTKQAFGDCQLHVEWSAPTEVKGSSQGRGNSGVFLMGIYELQVLDSYDNETYADGQASAMYGQHPPLANAMRKPGEWNTYDVIWRGPRFDESGKVVRPATITVLHNGVLTQDHVTLIGGSGHYAQPPYKKHPEKLPLHFQDHQNPTRFRNIWIRPLPEPGAQTRGEYTPAADVPAPK